MEGVFIQWIEAVGWMRFLLLYYATWTFQESGAAATD